MHVGGGGDENECGWCASTCIISGAYVFEILVIYGLTQLIDE